MIFLHSVHKSALSGLGESGAKKFAVGSLAPVGGLHDMAGVRVFTYLFLFVSKGGTRKRFKRGGEERNVKWAAALGLLNQRGFRRDCTA